MTNHLLAWRESRGLTLQQVADLIGTDKTQISKLEHGKRRLTEGWLNRLAIAYQCQARDLLGPPSDVPVAKGNASGRASSVMPMTGGSSGLPQGAFAVDLGARDLPVRGLTEGGDGHYAFDPDPIEWCYRPAALNGVRDAFALYVTGTSMEDVLMEGTLVMVHPSQPARAMDLVVVEKIDGSVLVKRLVRRTENAVLLRRYNPVGDFEIARAEVKAVFRVIATQVP
jgi:hypothetical protein